MAGEMGHIWELDNKVDDGIEAEAGAVRGMGHRKELKATTVLRLAFQSLGVVYGDLGTSPLYVFRSTFPQGIDDIEDVLGSLSLIIYTLTMIPLIKYVFFVMRANDNGEGGTFALYSLLCRHAKVNTIPNQHRKDKELTTYSQCEIEGKSVAARTKHWLEEKSYRQNALLILVLLGTCMVIGDGILTPAISVLSSVGGIKVDHPRVSNDIVVVVALVILVGLFSMQKCGIDRVGWLFAPVVLIWFLSIGTIGIYNICKHNPKVLKAFSPYYILEFFRRGKKHKWVSLGGIMLSITGTEALFADLGHFSSLSVQIAFTVVVFPCLLLAYIGQAAYLTQHPYDVSEAFYRSIPDAVYWPIFAIATVAAIIGSQATISATFAIIKQSVALGCFPMVKVVHTSKQFAGQIYIPEINWILMILCLVITAGFKNTTQIGHAYGIAVVAVMLVTTILMSLIMLIVWRSNLLLVIIFTVTFLSIEMVYFMAVLFKVGQGGWAPLVIAGIFLVVMYVWHYGTVKRYEHEMQSKVPIAWILGLGPSLGLVRVPGIGLVYTDLARGVPPIFSHFVTHLPAIHSIVVFVCVKYLPVTTVTPEERFYVKRIGPKELNMFRCAVRYGYTDLHKREDDFENLLMNSLIHYVHQESLMDSFFDSSDDDGEDEKPLKPECSNLIESNVHPDSELGELSGPSITSDVSSDTMLEKKSPQLQCSVLSETSSVNNNNHYVSDLDYLISCKDAGIVHILGNTIVRARRDSNFVKRAAVNHIYAFLSRICRENSVILNVPHESLLNVGQVFYV
ncbi:putative potassium transporter 12 isoform X1 [Cryptomeria japonica]|uniref:putative potassium transporter 12 isoform X1 n=1 Tax=Cryptomeria japonica TaxID=3369 RepID=UPI0027DA9611|nr:putative potassium transporter 12 isoform X1 [Cryptomeria japonica]XP_057862191.2 putative potassium transporter 12 isoform X1 [Cryptomeria japonica]